MAVREGEATVRAVRAVPVDVVKVAGAVAVTADAAVIVAAAEAIAIGAAGRAVIAAAPSSG